MSASGERAPVTSADGTTIGYRRLGRGAGLVLLHGGMMASQNFVKLGQCLSDAFTVFIPDRRGRGASGPFGEDYSLARDCEDVRALVEETGAESLFGLSSGAIIALESALRLPRIRRVAAFEPPFSVGRDNARWARRHAREVRRGNLGAAMLTVMKGTGDSRLLRLVPNFVLAPILNLGIQADAREAKPGDAPVAELIPTMAYDARIVKEASASLERFAAMRAEVLLMGGSRSPAFLGAALGALEETLPHHARVELPGVGHLAADNSGKPQLVADALRAFFS